MIDYTLTRSKRKTIGLYVRDGTAHVRAPLKCPKTEIDKFVASKEKWLIDKLTLSQNRIEQRNAFELNYGAQILFRGAEYPIVAKDDTIAGFDGKQFYLPSGLESAQIQNVCIQIYRRLAKVHLTERVALYAKQMDASPTVIRITNAKTRWGSCSSQKSINFSWRLIMACDDVVDCNRQISPDNQSTKLYSLKFIISLQSPLCAAIFLGKSHDYRLSTDSQFSLHPKAKKLVYISVFDDAFRF